MGHQQGDHKKHPAILMVTTLHHPIQQMYSTGTHVAEGNKLSYMAIEFLGRKTRSAESTHMWQKEISSPTCV